MKMNAFEVIGFYNLKPAYSRKGKSRAQLLRDMRFRGKKQRRRVDSDASTKSGKGQQVLADVGENRERVILRKRDSLNEPGFKKAPETSI